MSQFTAIAIDGPSAAGKSSIAKMLSKKLGFLYVDTGALYRAIGYYALCKKVNPKNEDEVAALLDDIDLNLFYVDSSQRISLNGVDVTDKIRDADVSMAASDVSALPSVRQFLLEFQRSFSAQNNVVMDGRDIGTVILPDATFKFFLTALPETRARRRQLEYEQKGYKTEYDDILQDIIQRDYNDSHRKTAPLKQAPDAVLIDSTKLNIEQTLEQFLHIIGEKI